MPEAMPWTPKNTLVEFELRDGYGREPVFINPIDVESVAEYGRNPPASKVCLRSGREFVVRGLPSQIREALLDA